MDILDPKGGILFTHAELACRATGVVKLAPGFPEHLVALRLAWARPMIVNSCCRSRAHNAAEKGHPNSLHVYDAPHWPTGGTAAVDFRVTDGGVARELAILAFNLGWSVGVPKAGFLHLDRREIAGLQPALFGY